jgi:uncharacterized protein
VHEIDKTRRRVSLTMLPPGTERTPPKREKRKDRKPRPAVQPAAGVAEGQPAESAAQAEPVAAEAAARSDRRPRPPQTRTGRPGRRPDKRDEQRPPKPRFKPRPVGKPKPVVPLTTAMKSGKEPLRTFGDLKQFFDLKSQDEAGGDAAQAPE